MPQEGRDYLRRKIHEYAQLDPETFYVSSTDVGMEVPGPQDSVTRNVDAVDLVSVNDEDIESSYSTGFTAVDAVQPPVEDGGEIVDTVTEWDRYGLNSRVPESIHALDNDVLLRSELKLSV